MIGRVHDRATFEALRRRGRRRRRGPVTVVYLPDGSTPPRVAFGIGRKVGNAVVRNQVRRRLRQIMREMTRGARPELRDGTYLLVTRPDVTSLTYADLDELVRAACREVAG